MTIIMNLYIEQMEQSIHHDYAFTVVFVQFAYCRNHVAIDRILTFFFYLILESVWFFDGTDQAVLRSFSTVLFFGTLIYYFWGRGTVQKLFWSHLIQTNNFCFQSIALFLLYHVVLSSCGGYVVGGGSGGGSQRLLCLNPTTVMVVLMLGLWLLLGCDNYVNWAPMSRK